MVTQKLVVTEISGLHLRPAGRISEVSLRFQSKIQIKKGNQTANAKSVLSVLGACIKRGDEIAAGDRLLKTQTRFLLTTAVIRWQL